MRVHGQEREVAERAAIPKRSEKGQSGPGAKPRAGEHPWLYGASDLLGAPLPPHSRDWGFLWGNSLVLWLPWLQPQFRFGGDKVSITV